MGIPAWTMDLIPAGGPADTRIGVVWSWKSSCRLADVEGRRPRWRSGRCSHEPSRWYSDPVADREQAMNLREDTERSRRRLHDLEGRLAAAFDPGTVDDPPGPTRRFLRRALPADPRPRPSRGFPSTTTPQSSATWRAIDDDREVAQGHVGLADDVASICRSVSECGDLVVSTGHERRPHCRDRQDPDDRWTRRCRRPGPRFHAGGVDVSRACRHRALRHGAGSTHESLGPGLDGLPAPEAEARSLIRRRRVVTMTTFGP